MKHEKKTASSWISMVVAVIGAGVSGLCSALVLSRLGHRVILIEKSKSIGGRMATRYFDQNGERRYVDTAARHIDLTEDTPRFHSLLNSIVPRNVPGKGSPTGINAIAKSLASQLTDVEIVADCQAGAVDYDSLSKKFRLRSSHQDFVVDGIILTAPVPQSIRLTHAFPDIQEQLAQASKYYRCLVLLLWPKRSIQSEHLVKSKNIHQIIVQNHIEANTDNVPIAVHATYAWSDAHYSLADARIEELLISELSLSREDYSEIQVKRWVLWTTPI